MKHLYVVSLGGAAVFAGALAACSSGTGHNIEHGPTASNTAVAEAAPVRVVVDNKVLPVADEVACVDVTEIVFVNLGNDQDGIALKLRSGDDPIVKTLTLGNFDGKPLVYYESHGGTPPTVTKDGLAYKIVGTASSSLSGTDPGKPFELEFTCPQRK